MELNKRKKKLVRYYFWQLNSRGWRQLNNMSGYATLGELKRDCAFEMEQEEYEYAILRAEKL